MNNYQAIRDNIQLADIILTRDINSPISKVIANVTHSCWSHSMLYLGDDKILETDDKGIWVRPLEDYLGGDYAIGLFRVKPQPDKKKLKKVVKKARKMLGINYNWLQLVWQFILRICGKSEDKAFSFKAGTGMICTEAVARAYRKIGVQFKLIPPWQMEPVDFDESKITVRII